MIDVKRIEPGEFDALREEWNALLDRSACDSVFLRWEWIHTWSVVFARKGALYLLAARDGGRLVGIAPFYIDRSGPMRRRTLKFCSEELSPDYMDIFAEKGREEEVVRNIVNNILQRASEWDVIALDNLQAESPLWTLPSLFQGYETASRVSMQCPYIKIDSAFDAYYQPRSQLRSFGFNRKLRILLEDKKVTPRIASDEESLTREMGAVFHLHAKRSKHKDMRSNFLTAKVRRFHRDVSRQFFKEKILSLHMLYDGETPISAYYAFVYKKKSFLYQTGFDPAYSKWSAGAVLLYFCVRRAFEDGLREFDFLKGTEGYKSLWTNSVHEEMALMVYNKSLRGRLVYAIERAKKQLRPLKARWTGHWKS